MTDNLRVAIIGPTGYTAYEAIRILLRHPQACLTVLASRRDPQPHIADIFPALRGMLDLVCEPIDPQAIARKADVAILCVPHLVPMHRGLLSTIIMKPGCPMSQEQAIGVLTEQYKDEPFVRVREDLPSTKDVALTNFCDVTARMAGGKLVVVSVVDNLIKGASGQAIQDLNIQFGLPETAGLLC